MAEVEIFQMVVGPIGTNCYIIHKKGDNDCVVIDPGDRGDKIADRIEEKGLVCKAILLTHGHFDHFEGVPELAKRTGAPSYILDKEMELIKDPMSNGSAGLMGKGISYEPTDTLKSGEIITLAGMNFIVIHTPGHTSGGCCYYMEDEGLLFAGDTIFMESIGRTDLPTGSMSKIISSVREKILSLPGDTRIFPGHGPATDVAYEMANNPYA